MKSKKQKISLPKDNSGFTIIESLMGIVVVSILMAAIAPVLVMSTATRVQSKRVELAVNAAKTFVDGVRTGSISAPTKAISLDPLDDTKTLRPLSENLVTALTMPVPTASSTDLYCFKEGNIAATTTTACKENPYRQFYIQAAQIKVKDADADNGYRLAIRVYRTDINFSKTVKASNNATKSTASTVTASMGDAQVPLVEMTTDIANRNTSFKALCDRLGPASGTTCSE
ncbi:hormogonium polysaccharide secretion pseudopilin HpsB [Anabaena sp. WFMT]|uniref:hormogonium polysaccharide secretion pseudopilin HpsB n=1 Tax=Anabaena sp. WFMT TaxID=3449730 RepID=UPI003F237226